MARERKIYSNSEYMSNVKSRPLPKEAYDNWDRIFGKPEDKYKVTERRLPTKIVCKGEELPEAMKLMVAEFNKEFADGEKGTDGTESDKAEERVSPSSEG